MFNEILKSEFPFVSKFVEFATGVRHKLSHAYLFYGSDLCAQYAFAMETARILNCKAPNNNECNCINCSWIRQNKHPAIITVSPVDYTYANDKGKPKTVITIEQARYLRQQLSSSSQYHRVIIFTDVTEDEKALRQTENLKKYNILAPAKPNEDNLGRIWAPMPLNRKILPSATANTLLKTIEEPSSNVTFFFLTKDKEEMISTIVSRCQSLAVPITKPIEIDLNPLAQILQLLPPESISQAIEYSQVSMKLAKDNNISTCELIDIFSEYLRKNLVLNVDDKFYARKNIEIIKKIEAAKLMLNSLTNEQAVIEDLFISLVK